MINEGGGYEMKADQLSPTRQQVMTKGKYQRIDGEKLRRAIYAKYRTYKEFGDVVGLSETYVSESIRRNYIQKGHVISICTVLEKPFDYFNAPEPQEEKEPIQEPEPVEDDNSDNEFHVDLFLELKKIEALLLSIDRQLKGKPVAMVINKGEKK